MMGGVAAGFTLGHGRSWSLSREVLSQAATVPQALNSLDPVLSAALNREVRIPNTCPAFDGRPNLHAGALSVTPLAQAESLSGHPITSTRDPHQDLELALTELLLASQEPERALEPRERAANEVMAILLGTTRGRVYDGFALLNFYRGSYAPDHVPGEYKTKRLVDTGETVVSDIDGQSHKVWHLTVNMLWYGHNFDSDTFLVRIPFEADPYDEFRVTWRIYSLVQEDLAPSLILNDGFGRIFHGLDSTFESIPGGTLSELTVKYCSLEHFRGMYVWGWGVHPPRVQFLHPIQEVSEEGHLNPSGLSFATRTVENLTLEAISEAAPEKKAYRVAKTALEGAPDSQIVAMLTELEVGPRGTFREWVNLAADQRQLPPEAWDVLAHEDGLRRGDFGSYDVVLAYMNNEIYGDNPYAQFGSEGKGGVVRDWPQGGLLRVKIVNLDNHTHYFRNVDFSSQLTSENRDAFGNGRFSFEKFNAKPAYGVPKVAEMQWRTGWGFVPHLGICAQSGVFPRLEDRLQLHPFTDQLGRSHLGYRFKQASGYFRFDPPAAIRQGAGLAAGDPLRDEDGKDGLLISFDAEAFGRAKMPEGTITTHPNQADHASLTFPGFLRNPSAGGDIIPPTPTWAPFLALHPETGTLKAPDGSWWADQTYLHGRPVWAGTSLVATIEAPRASGQLFYQFDPLFHDNMIFSLHPRSDTLNRS
jgi:hypothetical protein